jgi:methionyl-tRNA formyltransferase
VQTIPDYIAGKIQPRPQPAGQATHAPKIKKEDGRIDWRLPARVIWNRVRAFTPWPGAFTFLPIKSARPAGLKIWQAEIIPQRGIPGELLSVDKTGLVIACGQDALRVTILQREGGRRMSAQEFLAGHALESGQRFTTGL